MSDERSIPMPEAVAAAFAAFPAEIRRQLLDVRLLIFDVAARTPGVGPLTETLKWGEPAYLTEASGSGTTIRLGRVKSPTGTGAVFVNCRTSLVEDFRTHFPDSFTYQGDRAILLPTTGDLPESALSLCLAMALTYHRSGRTGR